MNVRSVGALLPLRWVKTRCPCLPRRRRRLGNWCWLLIVIQLTLTALSIVTYNVFNFDTFLTVRNGMLKKLPAVSLETASDVARCRREFIHNYEDFCRQFVHPHPSNIISRYVAPSSSSSLTAQKHDLQLCPCVPPSVEDTVLVHDDGNLTWDDVIRSQLSSLTLLAPHLPQNEHQQRQHGMGKADRDQLMPGGRSVPLWCIPRHRVAVIVPFRARDQHLTYFVNHLHPFLRSQLLDFVIVVVEQVQPEIFNRGALMNVGFVEVMRLAAEDAGGSIDCVIFHDVDLLPEDRYNFYVCSPLPRHMAAYRSGWNYHVFWYKNFFGGVNSFRPDHFKLINGFSNKFYGWGGEDDDLLYRVLAKKIAVSDRYPECVSKYWDQEHERDTGNPIGVDKDLGRTYRPEEYDSDGLTTLSYKVISRRDMTLYTRILVNLPDQPSIAATCHAPWRMTLTLTLLVCLLLLSNAL